MSDRPQGAPAPTYARERRRSTVPTPCIAVCKLDPDTRLCKGCLRTVEEIRDWVYLDDDERRAVWAKLRVRRGTAGLPPLD